jgi:prophage antirepressor-like protein
MSIPVGQVATNARFSIKYADIRHIFDEYGNPWFVAKDVCDYLEIEDASSACRKVWDDAKQKYSVMSVNDIGPDAHTNGISSVTQSNQQDQAREMLVISEPGLYQLIFMSRKPEADAFRRWVFYELLPQLRRNGRYQLQRSERRQLLPAFNAPGTYMGIPIAPSRFGRQPFMDIIRERGISQGRALTEMNAIELPDVPPVNTTYQDQIRGGSCVRPAFAIRASAYLGLPVEELFTEASRSRLPVKPA